MTDLMNPFKKYELRKAATSMSETLHAHPQPTTIPSSTPVKRSRGHEAAAPAPAVVTTEDTTTKRRRSGRQSSSTLAELELDETTPESPDTPSPAPQPGVKKPGTSKGGSLEGAVGMKEKLGDPVQPLRCIIVGHNPSETTWRKGHAYAHGSNHMWRLLIKTGIAPAEIRGAEDDDKMPGLAGVGFSDVGTGHPGTESSAFKSHVFVGWSENFYQRMRSHITAASAAMGCTCGQCGAPSMIAFAGKRQFLELLNINKKGNKKVKTVDFGRWTPDPETCPLPDGWPFPSSTEVWVCTSTSGAAVLTNEQREAPYRVVADRLAQIPWPRRDAARCNSPG